MPVEEHFSPAPIPSSYRIISIMKSSAAIHDAQAIRLAQLIGNSARCSKKRLFPLENESTLRPKRVVVAGGSGKHITSDDSHSESEEGSDSDDSHTTLGETQPKLSKIQSNEAKEEIHWRPQSILGSGSSQPLRMLSQNNVKRGKNHIHRFVGDRQPDTELGMANLFGAHPPHVSVLQASTGADGVGDDDAGTAGAAYGHPHYENHDESLHLAGTDVEAPPRELLDFIKSLAIVKISRQCASSAKVGAAVSSGGNEHAGDYACLKNKFDSTALVAIGILLEELVRDMMLSWYKSGAALEFDARALRTEALAQMNGAASRGVNFSMLKNQLEVLFNRDLEGHMEDIKVFHRVASGQDRQRPKLRSRHYLHAKNEHGES